MFLAGVVVAFDVVLMFCSSCLLSFVVYRLLWFCFGVICCYFGFIFRYTSGIELLQQKLDHLDVLTSGAAALRFLSGSLPKSLSFVLTGHKFVREFLEIVYWDILSS